MYNASDAYMNVDITGSVFAH